MLKGTPMRKPGRPPLLTGEFGAVRSGLHWGAISSSLVPREQGSLGPDHGAGQALSWVDGPSLTVVTQMGGCPSVSGEGYWPGALCIDMARGRNRKESGSPSIGARWGREPGGPLAQHAPWRIRLLLAVQSWAGCAPPLLRAGPPSGFCCPLSFWD